MVNNVDVKIEGLESLQEVLKSVKYDTQRKGGRFALRKAAQLIQEKAKLNAQMVDNPATDEQIQKNVVIRWSGRHFKRTGELKFRIGVLGGARGFAAKSGEVKGAGSKNPGGDTYYWRFLEFGTSKMAARPFLRAAAEERAAAAMAEFAKQFEISVTRAIKRAKKQGGAA